MHDLNLRQVFKQQMLQAMCLTPLHYLSVDHIVGYGAEVGAALTSVLTDLRVGNVVTGQMKLSDCKELQH
jgi:hypothetical protein